MDLKANLNRIEDLVHRCTDIRVRLNKNPLSSERQSLELVLKQTKRSLRHYIEDTLSLVLSTVHYKVTYNIPGDNYETCLTLTHINRQDIPKLVHYITKGKGIITSIQEIPSISKVPL